MMVLRVANNANEVAALRDALRDWRVRLAARVPELGVGPASHYARMHDHHEAIVYHFALNQAERRPEIVGHSLTAPVANRFAHFPVPPGNRYEHFPSVPRLEDK